MFVNESGIDAKKGFCYDPYTLEETQDHKHVVWLQRMSQKLQLGAKHQNNVIQCNITVSIKYCTLFNELLKE